MYNLNYTSTSLGYKVEDKLYPGAREQKRLNASGLIDIASKNLILGLRKTAKKVNHYNRCSD
jgi:hypothetical protein